MRLVTLFTNKTLSKMLSEYIKNIIESEILRDSDFINIDKYDIEHFQKGVNKVDIKIIECPIDDVTREFRDALQIVKNNNSGFEFSKLLFVVNLSDQTTMRMDEFSFVEDIVDNYGNNLECIWGVSVDKSLSSKTVKLIILYGFK